MNFVKTVIHEPDGEVSGAPRQVFRSDAASTRRIWGWTERKRPLIRLFAVLILVYLLIKIVVVLVEPLAVLEFAWITVAIGLAPAYFLRRVMKFENVIDWVLNAGALGILIIPYTFLLAGLLGFNQVFRYPIWVLSFGCLLGVVVLLMYADDRISASRITFKGLKWIDALVLLLLIAFAVVLTLLNFDRVRVSWDTFMFWGPAAKYVYLYQKLPDSALDIFGSFPYTMFHPINFAVVYHFYGRIVEQYASWINVWINLLASLLVYAQFVGKSSLKKCLILLILIITGTGAITATNMFSMYADTFCAFIFLFYILTLIADDDLAPETYGRRLAVLLLSAISLYLIKSLLAFAALGLIALVVVYDFRFLAKEWRVLARRLDIWLVLAAVALVILLRGWYMTHTLKLINGVTEASFMKLDLSSPISTFDYAGKLLKYLMAWTPYIFGTWLAGISTILLVRNQEPPRKKYLTIYLLVFGLFFFFCFVYLLNQRRLTSGSLARYTALVMYLTPLLFYFVSLRLPRWAITPAAAAFLVLGVYLIAQPLTPFLAANKYKIGSGSYGEFLSNHSTLAEKVLRITRKNARILIANDVDGRFTNYFPPTFYVRYFLMENSVGGHYAYKPADELIPYASAKTADYILLLSYEGTFVQCGDELAVGHNYLIRLEDGVRDNPSRCPFKKKNILDFGPAR